VFAGAFDPQSASAVVADDKVHASEVLDVLTNLAAKSLLAVHLGGEQVLYRLLDTSRAYALEKLVMRVPRSNSPSLVPPW
jgi:predicted ATPase